MYQLRSNRPDRHDDASTATGWVASATSEATRRGCRVARSGDTGAPVVPDNVCAVEAHGVSNAMTSPESLSIV